MARVGNTLLATETRGWKGRLKKLSSLDWSRSNRQWEGRAMSAGRLSKRNVNVTLTANLIKMHLGLPLTVDEQQLENEYNGEGNGNKKAK
jgi:DNA sulfur modification protein DndB